MTDPLTLTVTTGQPQRPLGSASTVLRKVLRDMRDGTADVPCNGCTVCCRAGYEVELRPDEAARLPHVPGAAGAKVLPRQPDGTCALLVDNRCSVYRERPRACKEYDCRTFALTGVLPSKLLDHPDFRPFAVTLPTVHDRDVATAVRLAVVESLTQGAAPEDAARLAVLAGPRYLPLARQLGAVVDQDPAFRATVQAQMQALGAQADAQGGRLDIPLAGRATPAARRPRLTRRQFRAMLDAWRKETPDE